MIRRLLSCLLLCLLAAAALRAATPEEVNRVAGMDIFGKAELWSESPQAVIGRLRLKCRAEKSGDEEIFAAPLRRDVFDCPASEFRLTAVRGKVTGLDLILLNKGDSATKKNKRSAFKKELQRQSGKLEKLLRSRFGRPRRAYFGAGTLSKHLPAWDCGPHVLLLDYSVIGNTPSTFPWISYCSMLKRNLVAVKRTTT